MQKEREMMYPVTFDRANKPESISASFREQAKYQTKFPYWVSD